MKRSGLLAGLACAAVLAPARALAQTAQNVDFAGAVRALGLRPDQRSIIDALLQHDPQAQDPNVRLEVIDVLEEDQRRRLFAALNWTQTDWSSYSWQNAGDRYMVAGGPVLAVVSTVEPGQFVLQSTASPVTAAQANATLTNAARIVAQTASTQPNGPVRVIEHPGTVIKPTGASIRPGMYLVVYGTRASDGSMSADWIDVLSDGLDLGY